MLPEKHHILIKKSRNKLQVWLAEEYIVAKTGVSEHYLRRIRYSSKSWNFTTISGTRYYEYLSVPDRKPTYFRSALPSITEIVEIANSKPKKKENICVYFEIAIANCAHYKHLYKAIDENKRALLCIAASIIVETARFINNTQYDTKSYKLFTDLAALIEKHKISYIPSNVRRLKEKIMLYISGTPLNELVKIPRTGNSNAAVFSKDKELESWLYELQSNSKNFSDAHIYRQVKKLCEITGKPQPSSETIRLALNKREAKYLTSVLRYGSNTRGSVDYEGYIPIALAPFAGDCWQIDATRVNMIAHEKIIVDENGKRTKVLANIMVCVVRDVFSGLAIGYSFDYAENHIMYINALKMAVETSGYLPYELVMDKFPGHNKKSSVVFLETLEMMGVKLTTTHKATGKAHIERWFNTMQQVEMQGSDYYYGEGIKSKRKSAHVSPEYLAEIKKKANKEGYDITDTINEYSSMIEAHNNRKYNEYSKKYKHLNQSPEDLHKYCEKPNIIQVNQRQINHLFGIKTNVKMTANGIVSFEFRHIQHYYLINDYDVIKNNSSICISYLPEDLSKVTIFKTVENSHWLIYLCTAEQFNPPQLYGPQAEFNRLNQIKQHQKEIEEKRKTNLQEKLNKPAKESKENPVIFEYEAEEECLMGQYTVKKAAGGYEDIELNIKESILNQLYEK